MIAALGLAHEGFSVTIAGPVIRRDDGRTTALMLPALRILEQFGVGEEIKTKSAPLRVMRIVDATRRLIRSPIVTFRAAEIGEDAFGWNIPNNVLNSALEAAISAHAAIQWKQSHVAQWELSPGQALARLESGAAIAAQLAVAADGRLSPAREAAGIRVIRRVLPQAAVVLNFGHSRDHGFTSTEFHTETGPCTQVPLPGRHSSLVWVVKPEQADELVSLDDATLSMRIEDRVQSILGRVTVEPGRQIYPLSGALPARFAANRIALVGEAAHVFPPIGAQGLNLGIRDVADLIATAIRHRGDPGCDKSLAAYDSVRRPDILARTGAVSLLNASLLSDMIPAQMARSASLSVLGGFAPLRAFFMREGMRPGSGFRHMMSSLREQVRR
jgi:2-octaprenyl-6-methoxyphenol hydroxylase